VVPDLESLLYHLIQGEVEFVVVGGFAAVAHGVSLPTQDVDVCCRFTAENLLRLRGAIADLHPVHRMVPARPPLRLTEESRVGLRNLDLDTDWGQLDCLGEVLGSGAIPTSRREASPWSRRGASAASSRSTRSSRRRRPWGAPAIGRPRSSFRAIRERQHG
jgi:hypothetical protein